MEDSTKLKEEFQDECAMIEIAKHVEEDHLWPFFGENKIIGIPFLGVSGP